METFDDYDCLQVKIPRHESGTSSGTHSTVKTMAEKLKENEPYNLFFTAIPDLPQTQNQSNSITFTDLLCPSLGELKCSLQINFLVNNKWLMEQYEKQGQGKKPLVVIYGKKCGNDEELNPPNLIQHEVKLNNKFAKHHSKVGLYVYTDNSLRVVVSTANLFWEDWNRYNQGLWVSPLCSALPVDASDSDGESSTDFKKSLIAYLNTYKLDLLKDWINYVKRADFSAIKVFLITSAQGSYSSNDMSSSSHCHMYRVQHILSEYCVFSKKLPEDKGPLAWEIIAQASSFGNLGKTEHEWLLNVLLRHLASHKDEKLPAPSKATIRIIYPTQKNVLESYYGPEGGKCMIYYTDAHGKQNWLKNYLHQWKADQTNRTSVMSHIKTYCRVSPCQTKLAWFLLTSANISKAAWGYHRGSQTESLYVLSYEVGVLFLPQWFNEDYFQIKGNGSGDNARLFPFIYDLPLTPYQDGDEPYTVETYQF